MVFSVSALLFIASVGVVSGYDNGMATTPPMGWSTWCTNDICGIPDRCSEYEVRNKADAMVAQGMVEFGYNWILLDDCWADTERDNDGNLQPSPKLFPSGMAALADYVHDKGMLLGLYTCIGTETCKKNRPGSYGHYVQDANNFASWGIDMVKVDNCHRPATNETQQELFTEFSQALNATGRPMVYAMCNWGEDDVVSWAPDIAQMYRIQMDHIPFYNWGATANGAGYGCGTKQIINYMADLSPSKYQQPHAWMDPDFLETLFEPFTMNYTNSRTEFAFWSLWSAPLLVATDPADMSEEKKAILMNPEVLAIHQDSLFVGGERLWNRTSGEQLWQRPLSNGDIAVILWNSASDAPRSISVSWTELGWNDSDEVNVRDLWERQDLSPDEGIGAGWTGGYDSPLIPVHDHMMLRLTKLVPN